MDTKPTTKVISVHRVIGRYEIDGTIVCSPAPRPGIETALVEMLIDERVNNLVKNKMIADAFVGPNLEWC
jgi:hypothetical protein